MGLQTHPPEALVSLQGMQCFLGLASLPQFPAASLQLLVTLDSLGLPKWLGGKESTCQSRRCERCGLNPSVGKVPWRRNWKPTLVFLPGKSHKQRGLVSYSPWGHMSEFCTDKCLRNFLNYFLRALSDSNYCWGTPNTDLPL